MYLHNELFSALMRNKIIKLINKWMKLKKTSILSDEAHSQKNKYHLFFFHMWKLALNQICVIHLEYP